MRDQRDPNGSRTRSEIVRLRRREQTQKRLTQSTILATRPLPPVASRTAVTYLPPSQQAASHAKRHYQASLSMPGIEISMPAIHFSREDIKWRLFSGFLSLVLGAALYLAWDLPQFRVAAAQVYGNQRVGTDEINAVLAAAGQPIFTLMPGQLATRLRLNYPELVSAKVGVGLPNVVVVEVAERKPVIAWQQGGGFTWIDQNGVAFRPRGTADNLIAVTAMGSPPAGPPSGNDPLSPVPYISADIVKAIQTLAASLPQGTTMEYDPQYGLGWSDSRGWKAYFGSDALDMALKLQVYQSLVNSLTQKGIYPALIDVQYANAPYYRMSQ